MAELSKQALKVENNTEFPNNNAGLITPSKLRAFNVDMIDSLVDEISYNADSASWNQSIDALEAFTASASGLQTGSLLVTASASGNTITFTKGDSSTFNVVVATGSIPDISNLNQATASLQAYTASANIRFSNLESTTASLNTSVTNINTFTASAAISITNLNASSASQQTSIDSLNSKTGSYATTGSNTFTSANTFTSISASSFVSASEFIGNGSKITGITASIALPILDEGIPQGNAVSMNFTGSGISAIVVGGTAVVSVNVPDAGTLNALTASFQAYTASTDADLAAIHQATASLFGSASLALVTASFDNGTRNLTFTKGDTTTFSVNIPDISGSAGDFVTTASFNAFTQSIDGRVDALEAATSSYITSAQTSSMTVLSASFAISSSHSEFADDATNSLYAQNTITTGKNLHNTTITKGTPLYFTGSGTAGNLVGVYPADAGNPSRMPAGGIAGESIAVGAEGIVLLDGYIGGVDTSLFASGDEVFVAVGGGYTNVAPTGSALIQHLGNVEKAAVNGSGVIQMAAEARGLPNIQTGYVWVGDSNGVPQAVATSSFIDVFETGSFATTGSNTFNGNQIVNGTISASADIYGQTLRIPDSVYGGNIRFLTGSEYFNIQLIPNDGDLAFSRDGVSNVKVMTLGGKAGGFTTFQNNEVQFQSTIGTARFDAPVLINSGINSNVQITGSATISSALTAASATINGAVSIGGNLTVTPLSLSTNAQYIVPFISGGVVSKDSVDTLLYNPSTNQLQVSASATGVATLSPNVISFVSGSGNTQQLSSMSKTSVVSSVEGYNIGMSGNPSKIGAPSLASNTKPAIFALSSSAVPYVAIELEPSQSFTDGRVTFPRNVAMLQNLEITGSLTASLTEGYVWAGGAGNKTRLVATSSFGGGGTIDTASFATTGSNVFRGDQVISGSINVSGSINLFADGANGFAYSGKALFLTNSVQTGITVESPIHFYQVGKGDFYIQNNVAGVGSGSMNMIAANGANLNISASNVLIDSDLYLDDNGGTTRLALNNNIDSEYIGIKTDWNEAGNELNIYGAEETVVVTYNGWGSGYDNGLVQTVGNQGTLWQDWNPSYVNQTWLRVPTNDGSNPSPIFPRGIEVTGSTEVGTFTASLQQGYVWVGNASGQTTTVPTSSFGGGGAAFPYTGNAQISGSLGVTGSINGFVNVLTISSQTASLDFNSGNFFTLQLVSGSTTHLTATNIKPGQTINLLVKTDSGSAAGSGSLTFSPTFKFAGGFDYTPTAITASQDLVSFVTFDTTQILAASIKNLS